MKEEDFTNDRAGTLKNIPKTIFRCFEPKPLPFKVVFTPEIVKLITEASMSLGNLSEAGRRMINPHLLIMPYLRKEAILSSKIEGTKTTLSEFFLHEKERKRSKDDDFQEVLNYVRALEYGLSKINGVKLNEELIKDMHKTLMKGVRGENKDPGKYKQALNWIGSSYDMAEARFIPCEPEQVPSLMENLIDYLSNHPNESQLIKAALMHYQFETIHPFRDGNGRLGRLMIVLFLCQEKLISQPLFYMSAFFEKYREDYEKKLFRISSKGEVEEWLKFFLTGIKVQANDALERIKKMESYRKKCQKLLRNESQSTTVHDILDFLFENPYIRITTVKQKLKCHYPKAKYNVDILVKTGILKEITTKGKERIFLAPVIKDIIDSE